MMASSIKKIFLLFFGLIFLIGCGSDVDPGKIEGTPRSSEAIYKQDLKFFKKLNGFNKNLSRITLDALSYCLLAEGKIDAVIESDLKIYDVAAIIPIVENAGGLITTWNNKSAEKGGNILATPM